MSEFWSQLEPSLADGHPFVLATVVATSSSAPREVGASMAVLGNGNVIGSISGGCVESDIYDRAEEVLATGQPMLQRYGFSDEDAFTIGLTCGGTIDVYLERVGKQDIPQLQQLAAAVRNGRHVCSVTAIEGTGVGSRMLVFPDGQEANVVGPKQEEAVLVAACDMLSRGSSGILSMPASDGEGEQAQKLFVLSLAAPPRMIVFGTNDFAAALVRMGKFLGYHVTLCDARAVFATTERFPEADDIVIRWPHEYLAETHMDERTVLCVLTHDEKFDDPLLEVALRSPAAYTGAMGSRLTTNLRRERLIKRGVTEAELSRLRAPIGLDIGSRSPEETAVSIMAEVISLREKASNLSLSQRTGPIHTTPLEADLCTV